MPLTLTEATAVADIESGLRLALEAIQDQRAKVSALSEDGKDRLRPIVNLIHDALGPIDSALVYEERNRPGELLVSLTPEQRERMREVMEAKR